MIIFSAMMVLCFVGIAIGMLADLCLFFKEVYKDGSKKNQGFKSGRLLYTESGGIS